MSVMTQEGVKTRYMGPAAYEDIITSLESLYSGQKNKPLPVSQHIDEAGKMRRLTLKIGREYVTVGFEPKAPALLPTSDKIYPASTKFTAKMKTYEVAVSGDLDKTVFGVWYRMDNGSLFMTSVDKYPVIQGDIDVEWIPPAFFPQSQRPMVSMSRNIEEMKIYKNKLITAVEWYFISMSRDRLDFGIDEFLEYFHLDESRSMPDMTMFLENISVFKNVSDYDNRDMVLNYLSETTEGLISGDAIVIGSRKIYNWLLDHIPRINVHDTVNFIRRRRSSIKTPPPEDVSLIEGLEQINVWKSSINSKQDLYERFSANQTYTTRDSIIMAPVGNKMAPFISMTFNRIEEALFAADYWRREKQIPSRKTVSTQADKTVLSLPRIMYVLTDTRRVVFAKNVTKGNPDYLYILYTGNSQGLEAGLSKQHAALLPLF